MASTSMMSSDTAVDLALLGLLTEGPRSLPELVGCVKVAGGDRFTPTTAFIEGRAAHLIEAGCITPRQGSDRLSATPCGTAHLMRLLRLEIDPGAATLRAFCMTLKFCLLDLVGTECRREVVATMIGAGRCRADQLETAQWAGCGCPMMERYLALEQKREAPELRWMQDLVAAEGIGETFV
jgi:hypothetical protein